MRGGKGELENEISVNNNGTTYKSGQERKLIGIDGNWYDITTFIPHHPGGQIIESFVGKDASGIFHSFHKATVLKSRQPVRRMTEDEIDKEPIGQAFTKLREYFEQEGYFNTDYNWYAIKFLTSVIPLAICIGLLSSTHSPLLHYLGAVFLAAFWQQSGFFMHDFEHNHFTGRRKYDKKLGTFFGTLCLGVSGAWWREEHFTHHALTTTIDYATGFVDPQMKEPVWVQHHKLWPFYQSKLEYYLIKIQHITFLPICVFVGRIAIIIDSMKHERRLAEIAAFALHWVWVISLLSLLPDTKERAIFYGIAATFQGILHIQLLISHYAKPFHDLDDMNSTSAWYRKQVESNIDITCPWWLDWFHGGLNFHLIHHLYPRMPRNYYREATKHLQRVCEENDLQYDHCDWTTAITRTLRHLKHISHHFTLDPR